MLIHTPAELGLVIRDRRRKLGLNQTELADRAQVGRQWLVELEKGKARAPLELVMRTLAALDLGLSIEGIEAKPPPRGAPTVNLDEIIAGAKRAKK